MSLIYEYLQARDRVTILMREHADARGRVDYFAHRASFRPFVIITARRQVDGLIHMRSIRPQIQPSEVVILPGPNSAELLNLVTAANLGCPVMVDQRERRSSRDFSKYLSVYYRWKASEEKLEEAKAKRWETFHKFKDVQVLRVCTETELHLLIQIRNSGGWIGGNIIIPDNVMLEHGGDMEDIAAHQGIRVVPWDQFASISQ